MTLPFLAAKTRIPNLAPNLVHRPHLVGALNQCLRPGIQLSLISAPAGFGKTILLAQWIKAIPDNYRVALLTLDDGDNHLARFFSYLVAAIQLVLPEIGNDFSALVESTPEFTVEQGVAYLVEQVSDTEQNLILILDDYHMLVSPEIHHAIKNLIEHIPNNLRLVIAGRVEPPLPLSRLRARGQLVEVKTADLRFSSTETGKFLSHFPYFADSLEQEFLIKQLNDSTEGWAAGLQMTALAMRAELTRSGSDPARIIERFITELSGSHRYILDYLVDEVLSREPDHIREFLLRTSLLERFNADLCSTLITDELAPSTQEIIEYLERANLFTTPLDNEREWYRYHHLFADVLQKQLLHAHADLVPKLHHRAAEWFEGHGLLDEALSHALQSGDPNLLVIFVEKNCLKAILQGRIATAQCWLDTLPAEILLSRPRLCLDRAWILTFTSQTEAAAPYLECAEALLGETPETQSEILGLRSYGKSVYGLTSEAERLATLALQVSLGKHPFLQCANHLFLASALVRAGKLDEALQEYRSIHSACETQHELAGLALIDADFLQYAAVYMNARNEAVRAKDLLKDAIQIYESRAGQRKAATLHLHVGLGKILFTENKLAEAELALEMGLQLDPLTLSLAAIDGWLTLWWVKIGQGDYLAARRILDDLEPSIRRRDEKIHRLFILTGALQDLLEGKTTSAVGHMDRLGFSDDVDSALASVSDSELIGWRSNEYLVYARVLAAQGKITLSLRVLERMAQVTQANGLLWVMYRTWMTQAMVHFQNSQVDLALEIMAHLLEQTSRLDSGAVRIYLSAGEVARTLLKESQRCGFHPEHVSRLLAEFPPQPHPAKTPSLPESLTERELDVLRLMAAGLKNIGIGEKLYISLNTIRYHTGNIFDKLGVDNRTAAVARAREMGIL